MRPLTLLGLVAIVAACRPYDLHAPLTDQQGLVPADQFAKYGTEQAKAVAIGRALAQWDGGTSLEARATQIARAADYAKTIPGVKSVVPDTLGYRLTVTFASGWRAGIVPIKDGVAPEATPGIAGK